MAKLLVVTGATGQQGGSVIDHVLADAELAAEYSITAITRDTESVQSQALRKKGVKIVKADVNDQESLKKAFDGAHTVFATTVTIYDGHAREHEVEHGRALADAAVAAGVSYYIYSTLPNGRHISGGKLCNMGHFDGKAEVEQYIRTLPIKCAFIAPGAFMSNFHASLKPHPEGDGTFVVRAPVSPNSTMPLLDTLGDTGKWVAAILANLQEFEDKVTPCASSIYTWQQCCEAMSKASGKTVAYQQISEQEFKEHLPPNMADHITEMLLMFQDYGYYGDGTADKVKESAARVAVSTTLEEYLERNPLQLT